MVTVLFGADAGAGCTTLAQSIAEEISISDKNRKVLLLSLSGYTGTEYFQEEFLYSIDDLYVKINSGVLTGAEIESVCTRIENLYILQGTKNIQARKLYMPEEINRLLTLAEQQFDEVLVDAGSSLDYGLSVGALLYGAKNILVTTQRKNALERYAQKQALLSEWGVSFDCLIINKFLGKGFLPSEKVISSLYKVSNFYIIDMSEYGLQAEQDNVNVTALDRAVKREILPLVTLVVGERNNDEKKRFWKVFRRLQL